MVEVEIDVCTDCDEAAAETARKLAEAHGVEVVVVEEVGPAGGWPVMRVSGPQDRVAALLAAGGWDDE